MKALRAHVRGGPRQLVLEDAPPPAPGTGDVVVDVRAAGYTPGELDWPSTWIDRSGHDRTPTIPCHEISGVVTATGFGVADVAIGDEVFGLTDWYRDGGAAEQVAVEARNLAPKAAGLDHRAAATVPLAGLTASQALFRHGGLRPKWTVIVLGPGGAVGSYAAQLAHNAGARVVGVGPASDYEQVMAT